MNDRERIAMEMLATGPKTTGEIAKVLGLTASRTHRIMSSLKKYRFVDSGIIYVSRYGVKTQWRLVE